MYKIICDKNDKTVLGKRNLFKMVRQLYIIKVHNNKTNKLKEFQQEGWIVKLKTDYVPECSRI